MIRMVSYISLVLKNPGKRCYWGTGGHWWLIRRTTFVLPALCKLQVAYWLALLSPKFTHLLYYFKHPVYPHYMASSDSLANSSMRFAYWVLFIATGHPALNPENVEKAGPHPGCTGQGGYCYREYCSLIEQEVRLAELLYPPIKQLLFPSRTLLSVVSVVVLVLTWEMHASQPGPGWLPNEVKLSLILFLIFCFLNKFRLTE